MRLPKLCFFVLSAGKAHDVMALKCRGAQSPLNFGVEEYEELVPLLPNLTQVSPCAENLLPLYSMPLWTTEKLE